ncbi:MAG: adenylate/guanylate cyclase domain-containing protein [Planctomycetota bacterium]
MSDLIASGPGPHDSWRKTLPPPEAGIEMSVGRSGADWEVPWDRTISRKHFRMLLKDGPRLLVRKLKEGQNPVYFHGDAREEFTVMPGECFVVGQTRFTLAGRNTSRSATPISPARVDEQTFDVSQLRAHRFRSSDRRLDALARLPDLVTGSQSDLELWVRVIDLLMTGIPDAIVAAVVAAHAGQGDGLEILHSDRRGGTTDADPEVGDDAVEISHRLVRRSVDSGEGVLHRWDHDTAGGGYTQAAETDWALAVPIASGAKTSSLALYVSGRSPGERGGQDRSDDLKFVSVMAGMIGNLHRMRSLQQRQSSMRRFFSPTIMRAISAVDASPGDAASDFGSDDMESQLRPRTAELTVLFADLRNFSARSRQLGDDLIGLLKQVSDALSRMTGAILKADGVIGDFHGDAVMGFWGWPIDDDRRIELAIQAAGQIHQSFAHQDESFRCGVGLATGAAVAGGIGSDDQIKVTALGPVVNLASRLEGLTKLFGVRTLLDLATVNSLSMRSGSDAIACQRLGKVEIRGWEEPQQVFALASEFDDSAAIAFEEAWDFVDRREISTAVDRLVPIANSHPPANLLLQHLRRFGANFDGVIRPGGLP